MNRINHKSGEVVTDVVALEQAVDPICSMTVSKESAAASLAHEGSTHYFCSVHCLETFRQNPGQQHEPVIQFAGLHLLVHPAGGFACLFLGVESRPLNYKLVLLFWGFVEGVSRKKAAQVD